MTFLVWAIVVQGAIGYAQYFSGVPAFLVALHVLGAVLVWVAVVQLGFATGEPTGQPTDAPSEASAPSLAATASNSAMVSLRICATGFTSSMRPTTWPPSAIEASMSPPK